MPHESLNARIVLFFVRRMLLVLVTALAWLCLANPTKGFAQGRTAPPKFEVASIRSCTLGPLVAKGTASGGNEGRTTSPPGRYRSECDTVMDLTRTAYGEFVPIWLISGRFQLVLNLD
jgi:hypothetical protein